MTSSEWTTVDEWYESWEAWPLVGVPPRRRLSPTRQRECSKQQLSSVRSKLTTAATRHMEAKATFQHVKTYWECSAKHKTLTDQEDTTVTKAHRESTPYAEHSLFSRYTQKQYTERKAYLDIPVA